MKYNVNIAEAANREANRYAEYIREHSHDSVQSDLWWNGLLDAIFTLERFPARCPRIPEQSNFATNLHQLLYESHRIIFEIQGKQVNVLRIYHAALRPLTNLRQRPSHRKPA